MKFSFRDALKQGKQLATETLAKTIVTVDQAAAEALAVAGELRAKGEQKADELKGKAIAAVVDLNDRVADRIGEIGSAASEFAKQSRILPKEEPKAPEAKAPEAKATEAKAPEAPAAKAPAAAAPKAAKPKAAKAKPANDAAPKAKKAKGPKA